MSTLALDLPADIAGRRAAASAYPAAAPFDEHRDTVFPAQMRANLIEREGKKFYQLEGIASTVDSWYDMWDMFGPYQEKIAAGAFDKTLAADPDVAFLVNHRGVTMARTHKSRTLELFLAPDGSLSSRSFLNPERQDVKDLVHAVDDGDVDQMSFAFRIKSGSWNPEYDAYTITEVDIHRGDVSAVNFGANPFTSIASRARVGFLERAAAEAGTREQAHAPAAARGTSYAAALLRAELAN